MLFNSIDFAIFLPIVFILYWFVFGKNIKFQNIFIVLASYFFYGCWDWRFLSLIIFSTLIDYVVGLLLLKEERKIKRKLYLWISIVVNIGFLGIFKYYNFFIDSFISAFSFMGNSIQPNSLNIILPVGISFYTFQTLSYTIDVYKRKLEPTKDVFAFAAFVAFFPQLVAGPIERASNLLIQFKTRRFFNYDKASDGIRQILWGLLKKVVIADNCAEYVNLIFNNSESYSGSTIVIGAVFFAFQIYGDFSGYSDIAIGTARLLGFNLMQNFAYPYFSRDIAEFWRRWHISLSTWFRDYLYIPIGGSKGNKLSKIKNTFIVFVVSGFWHGANWTFLVWGLLNALYFLPLLLLNKNRQNLEIVAKGKIGPTLKEIGLIGTTFLLTCFAWIFFRADNLTHAFSMVSEVFSQSLFSLPNFTGMKNAVFVALLIILFVLIEWIGRDNKYAIENLGKINFKTLRWIAYLVIVLSIYGFGNFSETIEFIYFQF